MDEEHRTNLRLPLDLCAAIDALRKRMPGNVSRNTWISMAIQEKVTRDSQAPRPAPEAARDA